MHVSIQRCRVAGILAAAALALATVGVAVGTPTAVAAPNKVSVCHLDAALGTYKLISVSGDGKTVAAHVDHGDGLPGGDVPGKVGYTFSQGCVPQPPVPPTPCPAGSYGPAVPNCTSASPGHYVPSAGSLVEIPCPAGSYQPSAGATSCLPVPAGSYVDVTGAVAAIQCPAGSYQPSSGATSCLLAPVGHFVSVSGATSATPCPSGTVAPQLGSIACTAITLVVTNQLMGNGFWGNVSGSGLQPGATLALCNDQNGCITSSTVDADGTLSSISPFGLWSACQTNFYARTLDANGTLITSNTVSYPAGYGSCA